jgi:probable H4MPT-linked C1 transfer pathway protein
MAIADKVPFNGEWVPLIAEHFATTSDIYRLTGELPVEADQMTTADGKGKSVNDSARRLARMIGLDMEAEPLNVWQRTAKYLATIQQDKILAACQRILSRGILDEDAPLIGAGIGRFVIIELARRLNRPYLDFTKFIDTDKTLELAATQCAPAVAVATLLKMETT